MSEDCVVMGISTDWYCAESGAQQGFNKVNLFYRLLSYQYNPVIRTYEPSPELNDYQIQVSMAVHWLVAGRA
jgi:hypothetical protein